MNFLTSNLPGGESGEYEEPRERSHEVTRQVVVAETNRCVIFAPTKTPQTLHARRQTLQQLHSDKSSYPTILNPLSFDPGSKHYNNNARKKCSYPTVFDRLSFIPSTKHYNNHTAEVHFP